MDGTIDCTDADALSQAAFERGLHLPPTRAEALAEALVVDERARKRLADSGHAELQQRIRTRAPARPDAVLPQRGRADPRDGSASRSAPRNGISSEASGGARTNGGRGDGGTCL